MWVHIIVGFHLLSTLRTTFSISWKANVVRNLSSQFLFIWECLYLSSVLKEYFAEYDRLDWQFFSLLQYITPLPYVLHCFFLWKTSCFLLVGFLCMWQMFSACCFQDFLMPMVVCCFICIVIFPDYFDKVHFPYSL